MLVPDYVVVLDQVLELSFPGTIGQEFQFQIPATINKNFRSILWLMVNSAGAVNALKAGVLINGTKVWGYGPTNTDLTRPFHEVIDSDLFKNGPNTLKVIIEGGVGKFRVSDIIIWYKDNRNA